MKSNSSDVVHGGLRLQGVRVLLVEGGGTTGERVLRALSDFGANIVVTSSCAEALEIVERQAPDVVLSDVSCEEGRELLRRLTLAADASAGCVLTIGLHEPSRTGGAAARGFDGLMYDASDPDGLASAIVHFVDAHGARRAAEGLARDKRSTSKPDGPASATSRSARRERRLMTLTSAPSSPSASGSLLLSSLPADEQRQLGEHLEEVSFDCGTTLYWPGHRIDHVYFPEDSVIALLNVLGDGQMVELGVVGREGLIGVRVNNGPTTALFQNLVIVGGRALRMQSETFAYMTDRLPTFRDAVHRHLFDLFTQAAQIAACNRFHMLETRLCRWLLTVHDRVDTDAVNLTHEAISQVLGVRRAGVTVALGQLHRAGAIRSTRGRVDIIDRATLESLACECYYELARATRETNQGRSRSAF
jgi:CRP-like cAMP-binding protein/CheY-like chemotaxis protein